MRGKAEKAIDEFYEGYNKVKERNIRENKWVFHFSDSLTRECKAGDCGGRWAMGEAGCIGKCKRGRSMVREAGRKLAE